MYKFSEVKCHTQKEKKKTGQWRKRKERLVTWCAKFDWNYTCNEFKLNILKKYMGLVLYFLFLKISFVCLFTGPDVQKSTVTFADIGGNDDKLVVSLNI